MLLIIAELGSSYQYDLGWNRVPAILLAGQNNSVCPAKIFMTVLCAGGAGCKQPVQAGDLEQIVDILIQVDEFQLAAALSRGSPDADEGADAHAVPWLTLGRST